MSAADFEIVKQGRDGAGCVLSGHQSDLKWIHLADGSALHDPFVAIRTGLERIAIALTDEAQVHFVFRIDDCNVGCDEGPVMVVVYIVLLPGIPREGRKRRGLPE